jgi:2-polyprenyl-6-methoxyphenol hydroxylase-like FAD-dependent oxidoreductase
VRAAAGLAVETLGAPMDVLWFRLPRIASDPEEPMGRFGAGNIFIMINRIEHWQLGYVIPKGSLDGVRAAGLPAFRARIGALAPFVADRTGEIAGWDDVKLLSVAVDRLRTWHRPGLLCIGDAAHAMSPVGGVGINLAVQDAVAAANLLAAKLRTGTLAEGDLARVQARRAWPTAVTQRMQVVMQERVVSSVLAGTEDFPPPLPVRALGAVPWLQGLTARLIGIGVRPEHVETPEAAEARIAA